MADERIECSGDISNCPQVRQAAEDAVRRVFAILGVDVDVPKEVEEFRENLRFGASMRRAADRGMMAFVGILVTALLAALWAGVVSKVSGHN
jgi:hypothetical protein